MTDQTEASWLRRAIRHCEAWGCASPFRASMRAADAVGVYWDPAATPARGRADDWAGWLPLEVRYVDIADIRARLRELEPDGDPRECGDSGQG